MALGIWAPAVDAGVSPRWASRPTPQRGAVALGIWAPAVDAGVSPRWASRPAPQRGAVALGIWAPAVDAGVSPRWASRTTPQRGAVALGIWAPVTRSHVSPHQASRPAGPALADANLHSSTSALPSFTGRMKGTRRARRAGRDVGRPRGLAEHRPALGGRRRPVERPHPARDEPAWPWHAPPQAPVALPGASLYPRASRAARSTLGVTTARGKDAKP